MVKQVNEKEFSEEIKSGLVFVDFFATWCGPCKMISPIIETLSDEVENVKFLKVDVDEASNLAASHGIMSIPTLMIFKDGKLVNKHTGFASKSELLEFIENNK